MNISPFKNEHKKLYILINETKTLVASDDFTTNSRSIAKHINQLAGVLKVHLGTEDKSLYPILNDKGDISLKNMVAEYVKEMGDLAMVYTEFKEQYNTAFKINNDLDGFKKSFDIVIVALEKRLSKEDNELYPLAEKL